MKYKKLGDTGLLVSELCLGTMTFGGKGVWKAIGQLGQDEATGLVEQAIEEGVNFFDTANIYSEGESETMLGQAVRNLGLRRDSLVIATKVRGRTGDGPNEAGLSRKHILNEVRGSLKRLQMEYIDLYQVHGYDPVTPLEETLSALNDLVRWGMVRYVGCSNLAAWQIMKAAGIARNCGYEGFASLQAYYSLAGRDLEREIAPLLADRRMGLMVWSPLAGGLLSGKYHKGEAGPEGARRTSFDFPPVDMERFYGIMEELERVAEGHGVSPARAALAWLLGKPHVTSVITGARTREQLSDNLAAASLELDAGEVERLDKASALPPEYPGWMLSLMLQDRFKKAEYETRPAREPAHV